MKKRSPYWDMTAIGVEGMSGPLTMTRNLEVVLLSPLDACSVGKDITKKDNPRIVSTFIRTRP